MVAKVWEVGPATIGDRIATTHTGSLPRGSGLTQLLWDIEDGKPVDEGTLDAEIRSAVSDIVAQQTQAGLDIVSDGEMGRIGYATYVKYRLSGFGGESKGVTRADVTEFPEYAERLASLPVQKYVSAPACVGPIAVKDGSAIQGDIKNLGAANSAGHLRFMTAPSPGVIALFFENRYYPTHETYVRALADAMRHEYLAIVNAGFILQVDCPDLAMGRHLQLFDKPLEQFRTHAAQNIEALNYALRGLPEHRLRMHICWGNYEGPHHRDVPLADIFDLIVRARPAGISIEASNPRHQHEYTFFERTELPSGKYLIPGVVDSTTNFIEHPLAIAQRIVRYATRVGRDRVIAGTDCGFGTFAGHSRVVPSIVWAKLRSLVEGARLASEHLWSPAGSSAVVEV